MHLNILSMYVNWSSVTHICTVSLPGDMFSGFKNVTRKYFRVQYIKKLLSTKCKALFSVWKYLICSSLFPCQPSLNHVTSLLKILQSFPGLVKIKFKFFIQTFKGLL